MITLSSAFLICHSFLGLQVNDLHPGALYVLEQMENGDASLNEGVRILSLLGHWELAECLLEQYAPQPLFPKKSYPRPPYDVEGELRNSILKEWTK